MYLCRFCRAEVMWLAVGDSKHEWVHATRQRECAGRVDVLAYPLTTKNGSPRLFDEEARARMTDPETSYQAAASVKDLPKGQGLVLGVMLDLNRPVTDEELIAGYRVRAGMPPMSESGIRTRRSELVEKGKVRDSGERGTTQAGRSTIKWITVLHGMA